MTISRPSKRTPRQRKTTILGLDPGIERTGYGVLAQDARGVVALRYGRIDTDRRMALPERLWKLTQEVGKLCASIHPSVVAVEELFFSKNVKTAMVVGQARGAILVAAAAAGIPVRSYTPPQVKQSVTGFGAAPKEQVQRMLSVVLGVHLTTRDDDAADALAIAFCCAQSERTRARLSSYG